jgi:pyruvate kinase
VSLEALFIPAKQIMVKFLQFMNSFAIAEEDISNAIDKNAIPFNDPDGIRRQADRISTPQSTDEDEQFATLISRLTDLQRDAEGSWRRISPRLGHLEKANINSARNLVHYLALRRHDIRDLQNQLARAGISSLGRSESHVLSSLDKVLRLLHKIVNRHYEVPSRCENALSLDEGTEILVRLTDTLLGPPPDHRKVRIMVTLPTEAADDYGLVYDLIAGGMDCARINCAHDNPDVWERMANNIRKAKEATNRHCRICVDISGPKLRTGSFEAGPRILKWKPVRDAFGRVVTPARIWLTSMQNPIPPPGHATAQIALPEDFVQALQTGKEIKFKDARNKSRSIRVAEIVAGGAWLEANKTAYIIPETEFAIADSTIDDETRVKATAGQLPAVERFALLNVGDQLILTRSQTPGKPVIIGSDDKILSPARVSCTLPEVFDYVKAGERIWFDDGKLGGVISSVNRDEIQVEINHAGPRGCRLRRDKGINLPDSKLGLPALTAHDRDNLRFVVKNADLVGHSFVRTAEDVRVLQKLLKEMGGSHLGIVLKIETRAAFENLPEILLTCMETPTVGVMIARGDLAVEAGFERLAEVQEEILWMCEAAHIPVIWATQVLEQLSKNGVYSRAEITDAAMSERAECVMLNKGPYVLDAVRTLDDVLRRMESHQEKKRSMMRPLDLAKRFLAKEENDSGQPA